MIGEHVVRANKIWELFILICQFTERLCAVEFCKSDLLYLEELLYSFLPQDNGTNEVTIELFNEVKKMYLKEVLQIQENDLLSKARTIRFNGVR